MCNWSFWLGGPRTMTGYHFVIRACLWHSWPQQRAIIFSRPGLTYSGPPLEGTGCFLAKETQSMEGIRHMGSSPLLALKLEGPHGKEWGCFCRPSCHPADSPQVRCSGSFALLIFSISSGTLLIKGLLVYSSGFPSTCSLSLTHFLYCFLLYFKM